MTQSNPDPEAKKLAQQFAQSLIQYAPLCGNLFIFGSFAWSKSLLETGIAAVLLIPTTIWAKFSEGFIEEFGVASNRWGKNMGKRLTQALELSVLQRLNGLEEKYIRAQGMKCEDLEVDGFQFSDLDCVPLLEQVFVPLKLHQNSFIDALGEKKLNAPGYGQTLAEFEPNRIYPIWEFLQKQRQDNLAIKAYGGYGKTTLLRHVAYAFMSGEYKRQKGYRVPKRLPVLIYLRNAQTILGKTDALDLPAFIHSYHLPSLSKRKNLQAQFSQDWLYLQLRRGKMLVMFDGFDEVRKEQRQQVSRWIGAQMQEYPASLFIVTSRPKAYNQDFMAKKWCHLTVAVDKFSPTQQQEFIEKWYRSQEIKVRRGRKTDNVLDVAQRNADNLWEQLKNRPKLKDLAENPLMLNIMVTVHRSQKGQQLPDRQAALYQQIFNLQLGTRITERGLPLMLPAADSQRILQRVAFMMFSGGMGTQVERSVLLNLLRDSLALAEELDEPETFALEDWLFQLEHRSELLVKFDTLYQFAHKSFQEFLVAKYVKEHHREAALIDTWQQDNEWENTVLLYATLVNPTGLIETLFDLEDEKARKLASKCLDITPRKIPDELRKKLESLDEVKNNRRYQKLESYLKNQDFKAADQETYRVMCEVIGQEEGYWFEPDNFENFPCPDLKKIDNLWLEYSEGKYGFSVQKEIWESCGSPMEYDKNWKKFGSQIGWYVDGDWLRYDDLNFGVVVVEDIPCGHLPAISMASSLWSAVTGIFSSLASRLVNCRIGGGDDLA